MTPKNPHGPREELMCFIPSEKCQKGDLHEKVGLEQVPSAFLATKKFGLCFVSFPPSGSCQRPLPMVFVETNSNEGRPVTITRDVTLQRYTE